MLGSSWSWSYDLQLPVQSVPITPNVVNSIPAYYVIQIVSDLWQVGGFLRVLRFLPQTKLIATI
jgi:hypothetical protein